MSTYRTGLRGFGTRQVGRCGERAGQRSELKDAGGIVHQIRSEWVLPVSTSVRMCLLSWKSVSVRMK